MSLREDILNGVASDEVLSFISENGIKTVEDFKKMVGEKQVLQFGDSLTKETIQKILNSCKKDEWIEEFRKVAMRVLVDGTPCLYMKNPETGVWSVTDEDSAALKIFVMEHLGDINMVKMVYNNALFNRKLDITRDYSPNTSVTCVPCIGGYVNLETGDIVEDSNDVCTFRVEVPASRIHPMTIDETEGIVMQTLKDYYPRESLIYLFRLVARQLWGRPDSGRLGLEVTGLPRSGKSTFSECLQRLGIGSEDCGRDFCSKDWSTGVLGRVISTKPVIIVDDCAGAIKGEILKEVTSKNTMQSRQLFANTENVWIRAGLILFTSNHLRLKAVEGMESKYLKLATTGSFVGKQIRNFGDYVRATGADYEVFNVILHYAMEDKKTFDGWQDAPKELKEQTDVSTSQFTFNDKFFGLIKEGETIMPMITLYDAYLAFIWGNEFDRPEFDFKNGSRSNPYNAGYPAGTLTYVEFSTTISGVLGFKVGSKRIEGGKQKKVIKCSFPEELIPKKESRQADMSGVFRKYD